MDQCRNCTVRGDLPRCLETECSYHELWMVLELKKQIVEPGVCSCDLPDHTTCRYYDNGMCNA